MILMRYEVITMPTLEEELRRQAQEQKQKQKQQPEKEPINNKKQKVTINLIVSQKILNDLKQLLKDLLETGENSHE